MTFPFHCQDLPGKWSQLLSGFSASSEDMFLHDQYLKNDVWMSIFILIIFSSYWILSCGIVTLLLEYFEEQAQQEYNKRRIQKLLSHTQWLDR
jgi:hypothetical protein